MPDLTPLIDRVRAAEGADRDLATDLCLYFQNDPDYPKIATLICRAIVEGSVDAALALVEAKMPGWTVNSHTADGSPETFPIGYSIRWLPASDGEEACCEVELFYVPHWNIPLPTIAEGSGKTQPLAIIDALLTALIDGGRGDG